MSTGKKTIAVLPIVAFFAFTIATAIGSTPKGLIPSYLLPQFEWLNNDVSLDSLDLIYPLEDDTFTPSPTEDNNSFDLDDPPIIEENVEYNPETGEYIVTESVGGYPTGPARVYSFDEYMEIQKQKSFSDYWKNPNESLFGSDLDGGTGLNLNSKAVNKLFDCGEVDIRPSGGIDIEMGFQKQRIENPTLPPRVQNQRPTFLFDMNINMSVTGNICDQLKLKTDYNTKTTFDFDNQLNLVYTGDEDDIIQRLEAGNVSFPLPTTLIPGSQSLFGIKSELQFGRLTVRNVLSQQKSKPGRITIENGAQVRDFEIEAYDYDLNRNFFLAQYFREKYNDALAYLPYINSQVEITDIEVWVTNRTGATEQTRDVIAFMELGESGIRALNNPNIQLGTSPELPGNNLGFAQRSSDKYANDLSLKLRDAGPDARDFQQAPVVLSSLGLNDGEDYKITELRLLTANEYTFDAQLGFISLATSIDDDDIVAVSFRYRDNLTGEVFQVGEFATDVTPGTSQTNQQGQVDGQQKLLFTKLLKGRLQTPSLPIWDLMMKNVYSLGAFNLTKDDFRLDVYYDNPGRGVTRFLPEGALKNGKKQLLISLLNLDRLNLQNDPYPDGIFDYIEGTTIIARNGKLIFPVVEPFGNDLRAKFASNEVEIANKYVFDELYDDTKIRALQVPEKNRFIVKGTYKTSQSSEFSLGTFNIPEGSIKVTAGGQPLNEGADYSVNYGLGRVTILNEAILNSGIPINIEFEDPALFGIQVKTFAGTRLDYRFSDNFSIGGTHTFLSERPFTPKTNYGDDPIRNQMVGADINYFAEAPWLTRFVDKIPFINTKEPSSISLYGEVARLIPGHAKAIGREGAVFIDDFEGSKNEISLEFPITEWQLSSTPRTNRSGPNSFPESTLVNDWDYGKNRALFNWYKILGQAIYQQNLPAGDAQDPYYRQVNITELFPTRQINPNQQAVSLRTFDLAFYPNRRGPYNFDSENINTDGDLLNPEERWGGITRRLDINDFEQANVEFIEFWMLDPFINDPDNDGELYFNLGTVSEDILKDAGRPFFENGLPRPGAAANVDTTIWARKPINSPVIRAFDNEDAVRLAQDVGLDGFDNDGEAIQFAEYLNDIQGKISTDAFTALQNDPANDDFINFGDQVYDNAQASIADRYSRFNHPQGNSQPTDLNNNDQTTNTVNSSTNIPDTEDLNEDNTLEQAENYFEYKIDLNRMALQNGEQTGENYIIGKQDLDNGETWYQFRIPIQEYTDRIGSIENFRSVQYMRMYMTGFERKVVCRLAEFNLVRNQWRRYEESILEEGEYLPNDNSEFTEFNLASVSIEENADRVPFPYVLPPGVEQEEYFTQANVALRQNEQSLAVQVCNLEDGHGRAVFKTESYDIRQFRRLQFFVHAEERNNEALKDGEISAFIRIGSDFTENYYEYEVPLEITRSFPDGSSIDTRRALTWPTENFVEIKLDDLVDVKKSRNYIDWVNRQDWRRPYVETDSKGNKLKVVGSPDLGRVKVIMLGVRNPKKKSFNDLEDDGMPVCAEVWFNELRLTDFDEDGGWAAIARADAKLADFGNVSVSGSMHTFGFGNLEQKVNDRTTDNLLKYDATASLNLDKFLPKSSGLVIPMYAGISESISNPEYDPYDTDVEMEDKLDLILNNEENGGKEAADSVKNISQTYEAIKSVNFSNVRKINTNKEKKTRFYSVENFDLTYAYNETDFRNPIIEEENQKKHTGAIGYGFNNRPKYITPFKKIIKSRSPYLKIIKDFNFNLVPSNLSFRTDVERSILKVKLRNLEPDGFDMPASYNKNFLWNRTYGLKYNLTRSILVDFTARNQARIDEPVGDDGFMIVEPNKTERQEFWDNIANGGRDLDYNHNLNVSYNLPINKIPFLDWTQIRTRYGTDYTWTTSPQPPRNLNDPSIILQDLSNGNTIQNGRNIQVNGDLNFSKLYAKSKFLKQLRTPSKPSSNKKDDKGKKGKDDEKNDDKKKKKKENTGMSKGTKAILSPIFSLTRVSLTYNTRESTTVSGFGWYGQNAPDILGQNFGSNAPGFDFIFGRQPETTWLDEAADKGWIITNPLLNEEFRQSYTRRLQLKASFEPYRDLKIDIDLTQDYSENYSELFKVDEAGVFQHFTPREFGSYSISFLPIATAWDKLDSLDISEAYKVFEANRTIISERLQELNPDSQGQIYENEADGSQNPDFARGYGPYSQEVVIPAFLAAYTKKDAGSIKLNNVLGVRPSPNWSLTYNGLSKLPAMKKVFTNFSVNHRYTSTYSVNQFQSNLYFDGIVSPYDLDYLAPVVIDSLSGNYQVQYKIPDVQISEQFSPLIGIDFTLKNGFTGRFEYKKNRTISLLFTDRQLAENRAEEFTIGGGYRIKGITLPFKNAKGENITLDNDLNFQIDFAIRDNRTLNYQLDQDISQPTSGSRTIRLSPTIDYVVNDRIKLALFFDRTRTIPYTSASFPITNNRGGLRVSFALSP